MMQFSRPLGILWLESTHVVKPRYVLAFKEGALVEKVICRESAKIKTSNFLMVGRCELLENSTINRIHGTN